MHMYKIFSLLAVSSVLLASCGGGATKQDDSLAAHKKELTGLKAQQDKIGKQVSDLEAKIAKEDPSLANPEKAKLVSVSALAGVSFTHYIDLQGNVDAENTSFISPRGSGGVVRALYVKKGDAVKSGQLLLTLDDAIQSQQAANARTQVAYARDLYQRRKNLWEQKIGAEVDLINAKNQVDQAESQLRIAEDQLGFTNVYADITGVVDEVTIKVGETFAPGNQQLRLINTSNLKVVVQVPEAYQERVKVGTPVRIALPELNNKIITGTVRVIGKVINAGSRSFYVEVRIPNDKDIRANQIAVVKIQDYAATNALTVPVNTLQSDEKGKYVLVQATENGRTVARKKTVTLGQLYADKAEIKSGLREGDKLITDGFQGLYEGQLITTQ